MNEISCEIGWVNSLPLPTGSYDFFGGMVQAGFPSPADDFVERGLDLNEFLVRRPASTFFARVQGQKLVAEGIFEGDYLVVDKSLLPYPGALILAVLEDGEVGLKRWKGDGVLEVWGVVTSVIRKV